MTQQYCPKCGAPAGPSAPDGDLEYRPPRLYEAQSEIDRLRTIVADMDEALRQLLHEVVEAGFDTAKDYNWPKSIADARAALSLVQSVPLITEIS